MNLKKFKYAGVELEAYLRPGADESVMNEIFVEKEYRQLEELVRGAALPIIDIGAHVGLFCLYVKALNPHARLFAYEPSSENFQILKKNLRKNNFEDGVVAKNLAVAGSDGALSLNLSADSHNHSLNPLDDLVGTEKVNAVSLAGILAKTGPVALVKMDCEGSEFEILRSLTKEDFAKIGCIYLEYHEFNEEMRATELEALLRPHFKKVSKKPSHFDRRMGMIMATGKNWAL